MAGLVKLTEQWSHVIIVPLKILVGDFNAKVSMEDIFKLTIGNEILHEIRRIIELE
jgi:hypothetical protein